MSTRLPSEDALDLGRHPARVIMAVVWPSFLAALAAEFVFFALIDPAELPLLGFAGPLPRAVVYTAGFFAFWALCALSSALTLYFLDGAPRLVADAE